MHIFKHPKFYEEFRQRAKRCQKELRERNKSDSVISNPEARTAAGACTGSGPNPQASSAKLQAPSVKHQASSPKLREHQATSVKPQAASVKLKPASVKLHDS